MRAALDFQQVKSISAKARWREEAGFEAAGPPGRGEERRRRAHKKSLHTVPVTPQEEEPINFKWAAARRRSDLDFRFPVMSVSVLFTIGACRTRQRPLCFTGYYTFYSSDSQGENLSSGPRVWRIFARFIEPATYPIAIFSVPPTAPSAGRRRRCRPVRRPARCGACPPRCGRSGEA